jgi:hypothetical protein
MGRARARPGGKRRFVLCYMKGRPGWSEAVDEGECTHSVLCCRSSFVHSSWFCDSVSPHLNKLLNLPCLIVLVNMIIRLKIKVY